MPSLLACRHTCSKCAYSCKKEGDRKKHERTSAPHPACNKSCNQYSSLTTKPRKPNAVSDNPLGFGSSPFSTKRQPQRPVKEESDSKGDRAVEGMTINTASSALPSNTEGGKTGSRDGKPSPHDKKAVTELEPIELDSDPDFETLERMLLSHRGSSSQSQPTKKQSTTQPPTPSQAEGSLKRQRSRPSLDKSSQAPTQTPQPNLKPAKRPRVDGSDSSDLVVVSNDRRKHPEFWDLDGTVILQVDDILFRVMRSTLSKASPWFQRLFSEEPDHIETMAGCPVYLIEGDLSHLDFSNLLHGLENGLEYALNPPHYLRIASIFRAASLLEFDTLRRWSLGYLEKQWPADLPPPSKPSKFGTKIPWAEETLMIADRLDTPQLIKRAYWELSTRSEFRKIDAETYDDEVEEIMPTRSRLSRSVLMDLTRIRERLLPEWTRITRYPPIGVSCNRAMKTPSTSTSVTGPTPCSLDYANWHKVILEVEINDTTIDDRRTDPISALEAMIVEIDWEKEGGFCADCVKAWKMIWTKDREKIWKNLGDWLGLDNAVGS